MSSRPTRWSPTPEQIMILEEMYKQGLRSPNTSQIQMITAHLSLYGKIEGKNVFYWFQNHKARDRQKLRKRLKQMHHHLPFSGPETADKLPPQLQLHRRSSAHLRYLDFSYLLQGTVLEDAPSSSSQLPTPVNSHPRKTGLPRPSTAVECPCMMTTITTTTYGRDCILMMAAPSPTLPPRCNTNNNTTPVKTLQLFPTSSADSKEERSLNHH